MIRRMFFALILFGIGLSSLNQANAQSSSLLKAEELDQLVAPIALYPDTLLSQVLIASTYPLELVEAERWVGQNKGLKGDALKKAADAKKWDDSVKSLTAVPDVLAMMSDKLDWTQKLGDAVLAQQPDVMDAIQRLRQKAQANDKLKTNKQQKVTTSAQGGKNYIVIEPAEPNIVYVPYYDPAIVYGSWPYPAYPPYYFAAPGYIAGAAIATGVAFAAGVAVGAWARPGNWWGGSFNWGNNNININNDIDINKRNNWVHNPDHRQGVRYNNENVKQKFSKGDIRDKDQRMDFRGRDGQPVLKPGSDRPGDRPGGDRRPDGRPDRDGPGKDARPGGDRQKPGADRPQARPSGDRPGGGDRQKPQAKGPQHGGGLDRIDRGSLERAASQRGQASLGDRGGGRPNVGSGGGRPHVGGGGGGGRQIGAGGGGGGRVGGGGGRGGGGRGGGGGRR